MYKLLHLVKDANEQQMICKLLSIKKYTRCWYCIVACYGRLTFFDVCCIYSSIYLRILIVGHLHLHTISYDIILHQWHSRVNMKWRLLLRIMCAMCVYRLFCRCQISLRSQCYYHKHICISTWTMRGNNHWDDYLYLMMINWMALCVERLFILNDL